MQSANSTNETVTRPDIDIEEEINAVLRDYPPLRAARGFFEYKSVKGHVKLTGNVGSEIAHQVLLERMSKIPGVVGVDSAELYDDQQIRLAVGSMVPDGVLVTVHFGTVILTGEVPGENHEFLVKIKSIPGIRKVTLNYHGVVIEKE